QRGWIAAGVDSSGLAAESREVALGGGRTLGGCGELATQIALGLAELPQRRAEPGGPVCTRFTPRAERRLDKVDRPVERLEGALEPACRCEQRLQRPDAGAPDTQSRRRGRERSLCLRSLVVGRDRRTLRDPRLLRKRLRLLREGAAACLELEQDRFGR